MRTEGRNMTEVSRRGRRDTPFTQNVRSMNFFSVFVNKSVDEQIMVDKLASQTGGSMAIENLNRDDKEMVLMENPSS